MFRLDSGTKLINKRFVNWPHIVLTENADPQSKRTKQRQIRASMKFFNCS